MRNYRGIRMVSTNVHGTWNETNHSTWFRQTSMERGMKRERDNKKDSMRKGLRQASRGGGYMYM